MKDDYERVRKDDYESCYEGVMKVVRKDDMKAGMNDCHEGN
jgi:hypothetical protein